MPFVAAHFVTLDRQDDSSRAGIEASRVFFQPSGPGESYALRFDAHGQWFDPDHGAGAYVTIPVAYRDATATTAVGDAEAGGMLVEHLGGRNVVVLHAGITLPTQSASSDARQASEDAAYARISDYYLTIPGGLSLRVGVSPIIRDGIVFARADVAVDTVGTSDAVSSVPTLLRLDAGVGVDLGAAAVTVESANLLGISSGGEVGGAHTGAVAARFDAGSVQVYGAYVLLLGSTDIANDAVTVGIEARLP